MVLGPTRWALQEFQGLVDFQVLVVSQAWAFRVTAAHQGLVARRDFQAFQVLVGHRAFLALACLVLVALQVFQDFLAQLEAQDFRVSRDFRVYQAIAATILAQVVFQDFQVFQACQDSLEI